MKYLNEVLKLAVVFAVRKTYFLSFLLEIATTRKFEYEGKLHNLNSCSYLWNGNMLFCISYNVSSSLTGYYAKFSILKI